MLILIMFVLLVQVRARLVPMLLPVPHVTLPLEPLFNSSSITLAILHAQQDFIIIPLTVRLATRTVKLAQIHQLIVPHVISQRVSPTYKKDFAWVLVIKVQSVLTLIAQHVRHLVLLVFWILKLA
jgi:hypothetical protein